MAEAKTAKDLELGRHEVGEIRGNHIWLACSRCGKKRWVLKYDLKQPDYTGLCKACVHIGARNGRWKGGEIKKHNGYILVKLQPEDFFYPMADETGYVARYRLVMAKHLGRCLLPWEVVHHKNSNKEDDRIENLLLFDTDSEHQQLKSSFRERTVVGQWK